MAVTVNIKETDLVRCNDGSCWLELGFHNIQFIPVRLITGGWWWCSAVSRPRSQHRDKFNVNTHTTRWRLDQGLSSNIKQPRHNSTHAFAFAKIYWQKLKKHLIIYFISSPIFNCSYTLRKKHTHHRKLKLWRRLIASGNMGAVRPVLASWRVMPSRD